jgi:hypothetical protein
MAFFAIFIIAEPVRSGICKDNAFLALPIGFAAVYVGYRIGMAIIYLLLKSISELRGFFYDLFQGCSSPYAFLYIRKGILLIALMKKAQG